MLERVGAPIPRTAVIELGDNVPSGDEALSEEIRTVLEKPYILFVSTIERRKNHEVLYRAYHLLARTGRIDRMPKLVFVGMPGWGVGDLMKDIELDPLTRGMIVQLNQVNDSELRALYDNAQFCVYPSLYEGWGLPVGEALALGKAVVASDRGSLPEVGGDLVQYVDPWDPEAWAETMYGLATNTSLLSTLTDRVRENYVPRKWETCGEVVLRELSNLPDTPNTLRLYPGYQMSTQVGVHHGPRIVGFEEGGFLMFGPHLSLQPNRYRVKIWHEPLADAVETAFWVDFVSDRGSRSYYRQELSLSPAQQHCKEEILCTFEIEVPLPVEDFEIRCWLTKGKLCLCRVEVDAIGGVGLVDAAQGKRVTIATD